MKRVWSLALAALLCLQLLPVAAVAAEGDDGTVPIGKLKYVLTTDGNAHVFGLAIGYENETSLEIPSTVTYDGYTYPVTRISNAAFLSNKSLQSVTLPDTITYIGISAFSQTNLDVTVPASVTTIEVSAFADSNGQITVLYDKAKEIKQNALFGATVTHKLAKPDSVSCENPLGAGWRCMISNSNDLAQSYTVCIYNDEGSEVYKNAAVTRSAGSGTAASFTNLDLTDALSKLSSGTYTIKACVNTWSDDNFVYNASEWAESTFNYTAPVTYTVTLPSGTGYTAAAAEGSSSPVISGSSYSFTVTLAEGYQPGDGFAVKANGKALTAANGVYTIENITENKEITVEGVEESPYTVTLPANPEGYTVTPVNGSASPVEKNGSYSFTVNLFEFYEKDDNFAVKANGTTLTETEGVYTISNITAHQTITVEGVKEKETVSVVYLVTYNANLPEGESLTGGTVPTDETKYSQQDSITIKDGGLTCSGYTFAGWNTKADGTGTTYQPGDTFSITGNPPIAFYAVWEEKQQTTVDVSVSIVWDDANDQMRKRPTEVTVNLLADEAEPKSQTITESDNWVGTFSNLPGGVTYTISVDNLENYSTAISGDINTGFTVTCTYEETAAITWPTAGPITHGQKLSESTLTGGSTNLGTFAWTNPDAVPEVSTMTASVTFTPNTGAQITKDISITVNKAKPTVTSTVRSITVNAADQDKFDVTLEITVSGPGATPSGILYIFDPEEQHPTLEHDGKVTVTCAGVESAVPAIDVVYAGDGNYTDVSARLNWKQAQDPITITDPGPKTYGDAAFQLAVTGGSGSGGVSFTSSDDTVLSISGTTATIRKAGTVTITATKASQGSWDSATATRTLTIGKKPLTVTAEDKTVTQDAALPALTWTASGLVNSDTFANPTITTTAQDTKTSGTYDIQVTGGTLTNADCYDVTYQKGTLTVTPHPWSDQWSYDASHHWHDCQAEDCPLTDNTAKDGYGAHNDNGNGVCSTCGYILKAETQEPTKPQKPQKPQESHPRPWHREEKQEYDSDSPKTGDITNSSLWLTLAALGLLGLTASIAAKKRYRTQ